MNRTGEKSLTLGLAGVCGVLLLLAIALQFGIGRGYHWLPAEDVNTSLGGNSIDKTPFKLPAQTSYTGIVERPLFNDDRKPSPEVPAEAVSDEPPPSPLNISLIGTMFSKSPELHVAMVRENGKVDAIQLKEGMPLPGDQAAWTLTQVKNRSAVFKSSTGDEVEVELAVAGPGQKPGGPRRAGKEPGAGKVQMPPGAPSNPQAEELQRRIEERRQQMRDAAERMKAQRAQEPPPQPQPPNQ